MQLALKELGGNDFRTRRLAKDFVRGHISASDAALLGTWADVSEALVSNRLEPPRIRLFQDGKPVEDERFMRPRVNRRLVAYSEIDFAALESLLRAGASLAVDSIDEIVPSIREAARDLEHFVSEGVQVNAYITWGEISGFGPHWDDHDTLIIQLEGSKDWKVFGAGRDSPMFRDFNLHHEQPEATLWQGTLVAGDILHVPRGWWHEVTGNGEGSLHLTFGFTRQTVLDAVMTLVEELRKDAIFRRDIDKFDASAMQLQVAQVKKALHVAVERVDLSAFVDEHESELRPRSAISLPWAITPEQLHSRPPERVTMVARTPLRLRHEPPMVIFTSMLKRYSLHESFTPLLDGLSKERSLAYEDARRISGFSEPDFEKAVAALVANRIATVD